MSWAYFRKALGLRRNADDHYIEDFLRRHHTDGFCNLALLSKVFRKNALRLVVVKKSTDSVAFDSLLNKDQPIPPIFPIGENNVSLAEIAFGSFSLIHQKDLRSSVKLHDFKFNHKVLLSYIYYPSPRRFRSSYSATYGKKQAETTSVDIWSNTYSMPPPSDLALAVCLLVNIDWARSLAKSMPSVFSLHSKQAVPTDLFKRFYTLIFDHFLQISVSFQVLSETIGHLLTANITSDFQETYANEIHEKIRGAFMNFQRTFRDLCIPRLCRPIWPSLSLAYASQSDTPVGSRRMSDRGPGPYQSLALNSTQFPAPQYESMSDSFVRGCLFSLISKNMSKDRCQFLAQLVTGVLMQHRGWISTVMLKGQNPSADCQWAACEVTNEYFERVMLSGSKGENSLLTQHLAQSGCNLNRHFCEDAKILNTSGTALANTIIHGNTSGGGVQQHQHRERLLALLYLSSYFLRPPHFLLQAHEQLPDLGIADLYEMEQRRRKSLQRSHSASSSTNQRKSSGQLSASLMGNQRSGVVDIYDSGIASQEDLSVAMLHTLQQYSYSAGSSPGASAICLLGRLTNEQCRIAEAAAQVIVSRELASTTATKAQQQQHSPSQYPSPTSSLYVDAPMCKPREQAWTMGKTGRNRRKISGLQAVGESLCGKNVEVAGNALHSPITPNVSAGVPCFSASLSSNNVSDLTEVPLLIEKWYDYEWDSCWCLGEGIDPAVLGTNCRCSGNGGYATRAAASRVTVQYGSLIERYTSIDNDDSLEVGTVCHADMECPDDDALGSLGTGGGPELILHSSIGASVLENYASGLALQATTEPFTAFQGRLVDDLTSWLRFAPALLRRAVAPPFGTQPRSCSHLSNHYPQHSAFRCSTLLVNADSSTVQLLTVRSSPGSQKRNLNSRKLIDPPSTATTSPSHLLSPPSTSTAGSFNNTNQRRLTNSDSSTDEELFDAPTSQSRALVPAPLVLRLLETVKLIYDRSGGCSNIALRHLETGLQHLCILGCTLADLLVPSITLPDGGSDAPFIFKQSPETIAKIIGCHRSDLPLLLAIASSVSCRAAAVIETNGLDQVC